MTATLRHKVLVVLAVLAASVGIVDAAISGQWDLVVVFALVAIPLAGLFVALEWGGQTVALRRDLYDWLRDRSALTGEPLSAVADRVVAAQQAALGEAEQAGGAAEPVGSATEGRRADKP